VHFPNRVKVHFPTRVKVHLLFAKEHFPLAKREIFDVMLELIYQHTARHNSVLLMNVMKR